jgi:hypothetical protein
MTNAQFIVRFRDDTANLDDVNLDISRRRRYRDLDDASDNASAACCGGRGIDDRSDCMTEVSSARPYLPPLKLGNHDEFRAYGAAQAATRFPRHLENARLKMELEVAKNAAARAGKSRRPTNQAAQAA